MRLALAGVRHFHVHHLLDCVRHSEGVELVGIFDRDEHVRNTFANQYQTLGYSSLEEMFEVGKPDVIACFDIHSKRAEVSTQALARGISVLCDKPPVTSLGELEALKNAALASQAAKFTVLLSERYNPPVMTLKRIIDQGCIGEIVNFAAFRPHKLNKPDREAWFFRRKEHGGILVDLAIHDIDVFQWIAGKKITEVAAQAGNLSCPEHPEFEDHGQLIFRAEGNVTGLVKVDWLTPAAFPTHGDCRYFVTGTRGTVEVKTEGDIGTLGGTVTVCTDSRPPYTVSLEVPETDLYSDFFTAIAKDLPPPISLADVFHAAEVVLKARDAADSRRVIALADQN